MNVKRILSVLLAAVMVLCLCFSAGAASQGGSYKISNPYADVDWDSVNTYKVALHNHTNASDGTPTLRQNLERHAQTGFDIVAVTDHGTVNYSWEYENPNKLIHGGLSLVGKSKGELDYLGKEGTFADGTAYTLTERNGDDYLMLDSGREIMRVPYGIENNAVSVNAHVNSWFADYHDNSITTYSDALRGVQKAGGVCVINHPGEYSKARYEIRSANAYNADEFQYWYHVNKWAKLIDKYDCCIGIDMNSKGDGRTRFDRILWDILLERFSSNGKNVFAICSSDAHQLDKIDTGFVYALMPEKTSAALRDSLENGRFFGASHCLGNPDELVEIYTALEEIYGESELSNAVKEAAKAMDEKAAAIENGEEDADDDIGITYSVLDDEGYCKSATQPVITRVNVDESEGTISIESENALIVRWISNGKLVTTTSVGEAVFDLDDFTGKTGKYVRAEIFGEGGIVYTQAFIINPDDTQGAEKIVDSGFTDLGVFDFLIGVTGNWADIISRAIGNLFR
ncbi:MAG: hypothetical protein IJM02_01160 [Clostridia bacterium]|nr:hypothetical protein [Clostridia bacterium]